MRKAAIVCTLMVLPFLTGVVQAGGKTGLDSDGFITNWLLLAPIPFAQGKDAAESLDAELIPNEAKLQPKAGDKVKVNGVELTWTAISAMDYFFNISDIVGGTDTDNKVAYAVTYVSADKEMKDVRLLIGSDDQAKVYFNGKQVIHSDQVRATNKDQNSATVTLNKGVNVIVFKIVNEGGDWSGCARFVAGPITNIRASTTAK